MAGHSVKKVTYVNVQIIGVICVYRPYQEYFTYIELIVRQNRRTQGENYLSIRKQNLAFPHDPSEARTTAVRNLTD